MKPQKLITEVVVAPSVWKINHNAQVITCGSCFADVLGGQLHENKFPVLNNPFGTVFNPLSIARLLELALDGKLPDPALYHQDADGIWLHHDFHSSIWGTDRKSFEALLANKLESVRKFLKTANLLVITFGSAYSYRHRGSNLIVGNCHKVPSDRFLKELLNQDQLLISFEQLLFKLQAFNRNLKVILTVSPVRHTRDTLPLNQVSKAILRLISHRLSEKFRQVEYFPAYEMMMDELRDYRFYEDDLIHPNKLAEEHIFGVFTEVFMEAATIDFIHEWQSVRKMMLHRPAHGRTRSQLMLLKTIHDKLSKLSLNGNFSEELTMVKARIDEFPVELQTH